jgi:hypothetical protein
LVYTLGQISCRRGDTTDAAVRNSRGTAKPYEVSDGGGLFVLVQPDGRCYWRLAYRFAGKQKTLALGVYPDVSLVTARKRREDAKEKIALGVDPSHTRKLDKLAARAASANNFEAVAREWHANQLDRWTPEHAERTIRRLERNAFSVIGARPVGEIEPPELLVMLRRVEARGALDIAKRVKEHCGQIFRYAIVTGRAKRGPSADLKGALRAAPASVHPAAMPRCEMPEFLRKLDAYDGEPTTKMALRLVLQTFVRTKELRLARWTEFEGLATKAALWRIPPARMKLRREHLVPCPSNPLPCWRLCCHSPADANICFRRPARRALCLRTPCSMRCTAWARSISTLSVTDNVSDH